MEVVMCKLGGRPCPNLSQLNRIIGRPSYFDARSHHYKLVRIILERDGIFRYLLHRKRRHSSRFGKRSPACRVLCTNSFRVPFCKYSII